MKIGYARCSTKKQSMKAQIQLLKNVGVHKIFAEHYTGKTTKRPKFQEMMNQLRKGDEVYLVRMDRFARNMRMALNAIHEIRIKGCTMRVLYPYPKDIIKNVDGRLKTVNTNDIYMALMFAEAERKAILWRTKQGRIYKKKINPNAYHAKMGRKGRMAKYPNFYRDVYNYKKTHSASQTAKHFYNQNGGKYHGKHISVREVYSIKEMFDAKARKDAKAKENPNQMNIYDYLHKPKTNKKPIKISDTLKRKLELQDKLQSENDDLILNSQDLSLLKLSNPPLYRRKYTRQRKAKANIRKAIRATKSALSKLNK